MRIATWNVNSVRARLDHVRRYLEQSSPDVLCLQETKVTDSEFPEDTFVRDGYQTVRTGQPGYNGVAILSRISGSDTVVGLDGAAEDEERRLIRTTLGELRVLSAYVPNGKAIDNPGYQDKLAWLARLARTIDAEHALGRNVVLAGDFNIARDARDVWDPDRMVGQLHFSDAEHAALEALLGTGLVDALRETTNAPGQYSWWDYRMSAFRRNRGLRIDYVFISTALRPRLVRAEIDRTPRGWDKPSDHTPVVIELAPPH